MGKYLVLLVLLMGLTGCDDDETGADGGRTDMGGGAGEGGAGGIAGAGGTAGEGGAGGVAGEAGAGGEPVVRDCVSGCDFIADCATGDDFCPALGPDQRMGLVNNCQMACAGEPGVLEALQGAGCAQVVAALLAAVPGFSDICEVEAVVGPACPPNGPVLVQPPLALSDVAFIAPIGSLVPPDHTFPTPHMYFYVYDNDPATENDKDSAPFVAPADLLVTAFGLRSYDSFNGTPNVQDFDLEFTVCQEVQGYFIHVRSVDHPALLAAVEAAIVEGTCDLSGPGTSREGVVNERSCRDRLPEPVRVAAGERIGLTGDRAVGLGGLDMGIRDYRDPEGRSGFANPDRWCRADQRDLRSRCYAVSPLALMPPAVVEPYLDLVGDNFGFRRTEEPRTGNSIHLDVDRTAQGYWFPLPEVDPQSLMEGPESLHLYLGPNELLPSAHTFSVGNRLLGAPTPLPAGIYSFLPAGEGLINRGFDAVMPGGVYCYELLSGQAHSVVAGETQALGEKVIVLGLEPDGRNLRIEAQPRQRCGEGPWVLGGGAVGFTR